MRDLDLLADYLMRLRQEKLHMAHLKAIQADGSLLDIKVCAYQADLCDRIRDAVKVLAHDSGKFIEEFLK